MKKEETKRMLTLSKEEEVTTFGGYAPPEKPDPLNPKVPEPGPIIFDPRCW